MDWVHMFLFLPLLCFCDKCFYENKMCDMHGDNLLQTETGISGPECHQLCKDERECAAFTYFGEESFPYKEVCHLFDSCSTLDVCENCFTSFMNSTHCTCGMEFEGVVDSENLILIEEDVQFEKECKRLCSDNELCNIYTYYNETHATNKQLCTLLTHIGNPVMKCENCQTGPDYCDLFGECKLGLFSDGSIFFSKKMFITESKTITYIPNEPNCYQAITKIVAVGSGGPTYTSGCQLDYVGGGGSGFINTTEIILTPNTNIQIIVDASSGERTSVKMADTGELLLHAENSLTSSHCARGGDGYSGGGGAGDIGGDGGTSGSDGYDGNPAYGGGEGSNFDISSISSNQFVLSAGKGGKGQGRSGGGGGGVLVDGSGPEGGNVEGYGKGFGGGAGGKGNNEGLPGCVLFEL